MRLCLASCLLITALLPAAEEDLLTSIVAAQQGVERVQGELTQSTRPATDPTAEANIYSVQFFFELPDRYHLLYQDPTDLEVKEWWLSDGTEQVHAEQLAPEMEPIISRKPVDERAWGFQRVADFFRLDRAALEQDFTLAARPATAEDGVEGAAAVVELTPKGGRMADEVQAITVVLDDQHRTRRVVLLDQQDNRIVIDVERADYAAAIDPQVFTWPGS